MAMIPNLINLIIIVLIFLPFCAGVIVLQVYLSTRESKLLGLILPAVSFGLSALVILAFLFFSVAGYRATEARIIDAIYTEELRLIEIQEAREFAINELELGRLAEQEEMVIHRLHDAGTMNVSWHAPLVSMFFMGGFFNVRFLLFFCPFP